ncbi:MAG: cadherin-like domain-containing protein, partial [Geminicoccaceae bacterium]
PEADGVDGGLPANTAPVATDDSASTDQDVPLIIPVADLLANDSDGDGDPIDLDSFAQAANGSVTDNGDGTLTYTPNAGFSGDDSFSYTVTDGIDSDMATVDINVSQNDPAGEASSAILSDDFSGSGLESFWSSQGPAGNSSLGAAGGEAYLELAVPQGNFDVWNENRGHRLLQATDNTDFQVEARFLTTPSERHQIQGILIEQDADNWIRFDTYYDGSRLRVFAAITTDGSSDRVINRKIDPGEADYLQLTRSGDDWTLTYSGDGQNWTQAASFTHAMTVAAVGPFAGATRFAPDGYTAQVDYFFNTASPIVPEDDGVDGGLPANTAPVATDDSASTDQDVPLIIPVADLLANDSDGVGDPIDLDSFAHAANGSVTDNGDGTLTYTPNAGFSGDDSFDYTITDGTDTDTGTVMVTVTSDSAPANTAPVAVDDEINTDEDVPVIIPIADLLSNDTDADNDTLDLDGFGQPTNGSVTDNGDGTLTYTPDIGFSGGDSFGYTVTDGIDTDTATVNLTVVAADAPPPTGGSIQSDDFNSWNLDPSLWTVGLPSDLASVQLLGTGTGDAALSLSVPKGDFDLGGAKRNEIHALQAASDEDFSLQAGLKTTPSEKHQSQGILVEQDSDTWIRFDTLSDGNKQFVHVVATVNDVSTDIFRARVPNESVQDLRVDRSGDTWTVSYSEDGQTWTSVGSFDQALSVNAVGPFATATKSAPGFTAEFDYFFNRAAPISNEDQGTPPADTVAPLIQAVRPDYQDDQNAQISFVTDEPTTVAVRYGLTPALELGTIVVSNPSHDHSVALDDLALNQDIFYEITATDGVNQTSTFDGSFSHRPAIFLWYGEEQTFGEPGEAQQWVNLLGNVSGAVDELTYSLNGGAERNLTVGANTTRLPGQGDFNVDIDYAELDGSAVDDVVTIKAEMISGEIITQDVVVRYEDGDKWDPNYTLDWGSVDKINDAVQVVDGLWSHDAAGARPALPGYDRVLALGDKHWDNFEAEFKVTTHDVAAALTGELGFGLLWNGHTDEPVAGRQPKVGWEPHAALIHRRGKFAIHQYSEFSEELDVADFDLQDDKTYQVKLQIEQANAIDRTYRLKVWEEGDPEPGAWLLEGTEDFTAPVTGSLYLNAHFMDVTFGDVQINEITGNDILIGEDGNDQLLAFDFGQGDSGAAETDVFVGGGGSDTFVLGDVSGAFYDDGDPSSEGLEDYGLIWDFESGSDELILAGSADDYLIGAGPSGLPSGTGVYLNNGSGPDELVGVLNGIASFDLLGDDVSYVSTAVA